MDPKKNAFFLGLTALLSVIGGVILVSWMAGDVSLRIVKRVTDLESEAKARSAAEKGAVDISGHFESFQSASIMSSSSPWPNFRGPDMDNIAKYSKPLVPKWGASGPHEEWSVGLGEGHGGAAVLDGRVYMLDYDEERKGDALRCFALDSGLELWRRWYEAPTKRNHGRSRTVPAVSASFVVTIGPRGFVQCVETETGNYLWGIDLVKEYGTEIPHWYTAQCPLIENDVVILAPAGSEVVMMGVDCQSGQVLWKTPNKSQLKMSHASIIPVVLGGKRTYVYAAVGGVVGVSAEEADRGSLLWSNSVWRPSVAAPSPVPIDGQHLFLTAGYGAGSCMLEISPGEPFAAEVIQRWDKTQFSCEQQTPIFWKNHLFSVLPKDAGANRAQFVCMDLDGNIVWKSGKEHRFGLGPFLLVGNRFLILDDNGMLTMLKASLTEFELLGQYQVLKGRDAWGPMAFVDGKLLLRDSTRLACLDLTRKTDE